MKPYLIKILFLLSLITISACQSDQADPVKIPIEKGVSDLSTWQLEAHGAIRLDGDWRFFWKELVSYEDLISAETPEMTGYYDFPNTWNKYRIDGREIGGIGYGTFVLKLIVSEEDIGRPLAIYANDLDSAFKLTVNGELAGSSGIVGVNKVDSTPETRAKLIRFTPKSAENTIILQISNFDYTKGGPWSSLILGSDRRMSRSRDHRMFMQTLMNGAILMMALYHLVLAGLRKEEKSALFFSAFCLLIALRSLMTGERFLMELIPGIGYELAIKLEFLSFYLSVPLALAYLHSLYPSDSGKRLPRFAIFVGLLFSMMVIITPPTFFGRTLSIYQLFTIVVGLYMVTIVVMALIRKREGAWVVTTGIMILFVTAVNDILHANEVFHSTYLVSFGFLIFIFSQAYLLSQKMANAFRDVEKRKNELSTANRALVKEIDENKKLSVSLKESHQRFQDSRIALILGLAKLAEYRDEDTGLHLERMREYTRVLAETMTSMEAYKGYISEEYIQDIYQSAILHDIGKVGIKDYVLLKPGKLTEDEFNVIKTHPMIGGDAIKQVESKIKIRSFLTLGRDIAYFHHEKWDGSGYPYALRGENIPLSARIVALADVYDALTSERPYKKPFSHEKATGIIISTSGSHFDPSVVDAFKMSLDRFDDIRGRLQE